MQQVPVVDLEDPFEDSPTGATSADGTSAALQDDHGDDDLVADLLLAPEADSPDPCTDGGCSPARPSACPVAEVGGGRYAPPAAQARVVRRRWGRCAHPGCRRRATACDLDHVVPHRRGGPAGGGGTTCACNLEPKCRRHHLLKHGGRQDLADPDDGWVRWTARWQQWRCERGSSHWRSPLGFEHHSTPRPAALPDERYRPTPWPPRNPVEEERLGRRHSHHAQHTDLAPPPAASRRERVLFPDDPPF